MKPCENGVFEPIYSGETHAAQVGHLLTQIHAVYLLHKLGHYDLAQRALVPLALKRKLLRRGWFWTPDEPTIAKAPCPFLPTEAAFWQQDLQATDWDLGHYFKYAWSWYSLRELMEEVGVLSRAERQFRRLMSIN